MGLTRQVWLRRNNFVHEGTFAHPDTLIRKAYSSIDEYDAACSMEGLLKEPGGIVAKEKWQAPPMGSTRQTTMPH
jgi:hypothetical protein